MLENRGFVGGMVLAWRSSDMEVLLCKKQAKFIQVRVKMKVCQDWLFTTIYVSPQESIRKLLWEELKVLKDSVSEPWMLAGDFNEISYPTEKKGGVSASAKRCETFCERMKMCMLNDLVSHGPKFTWRGHVFHGG